MQKIFILMITVLVCNGQVIAGEPEDSAYLEGKNSNSAVILLHGKGKHPTGKIVNPLRKSIHQQLGFHTLSLQMPKAGKNFRNYAEVFPEASRKIQGAINFLKDEKGVTRIYLLGHSMGSRMASYFMSTHPDSGVAGLVLIGCRNNGGHPFSCAENLSTLMIPVLDIWGGKDGKDTAAANDRVGLVSDRYNQVEITSANHKFEGEEKKLSLAINDWLKSQ